VLHHRIFNITLEQTHISTVTRQANTFATFYKVTIVLYIALKKTMKGTLLANMAFPNFNILHKKAALQKY
jgi:hypothetical protein